MNEEPARPDPDRLLELVEREEERARRGKLRIFFGASAGVGKTYAMLEAARATQRRGVDIVVGYVQSHGRRDTEQLLQGLQQLPPLLVAYAGAQRREFDLDAALRRRAAITLVDELAHSNLEKGEPQQRHLKRWQDVEEMLASGLDVWTTVNVQHLESLNDVVAGISGIRQTETIPDKVFDEADEVELIDLPADDLIERLRAGKVYVPDQVQHALDRFFRKPNLIALRELALRRTADRVDASALEYEGHERTSRPWLARDRFLVAVAPDEQGEALVRFGKRFADALDAEWTVVSVETPGMLRLGEAARDRRIDVLRLAESLGAETVTLDGPTPAAAILEYAGLRNATRIVVGESHRHGLWALLRQSTPEVLLRKARGIDVSVIAHRPQPSATVRPAARRDVEPAFRWQRYAWAAGMAALCTAIAALMSPHFDLTNLVMVYLLGAAIAGLQLGRGPAVLTVVLAVLNLDFFFVPPRFTFAVTDAQYLVTFLVMLLVALTIATLMANVRQQNRVAGARERRTAMLYAMSRELAVARGRDEMQSIAFRHVAETFTGHAAVLLPDAQGSLGHVGAQADVSIAQWVLDHGRPAGLGADALPGAPAVYLPLAGSNRVLGVLCVLPENHRRVLLPEQRHLLETFAGQIALAIERTTLAEAADKARLSAETEALRNTLLASISHDLRTPLAVISAASSTLADQSLVLDPESRRALIASIGTKSKEMEQLVSNVLDLMRFETGPVPLRWDWEAVDDLLGLALQKIEHALKERQVKLHLPEDLPLVRVDATLVVQLLTNLLNNIVRHAPLGKLIEIAACTEGDWVRITVDDDGPGLPAGSTERLFAKFQRGREEGESAGAGLGLAICRAIVEAHGGTIRAMNRPSAPGARFEFTLPIKESGGVTDAMFRVLVVEDDAHIRAVLRTLLESAGYRVEQAETAARALIEARSNRPDAVLVDLGLPDRDGQQLIRDIRTFSTVPILVLSARSAEQQKILALDHGADDYVTKPFEAGELLARLRAALRRSVRTADQSAILILGRLTVDLARRDASEAGVPVHLTPLEFRLLEVLARNLGLVVMQEQVMRQVWGPARLDDTRRLRSYIRMLRQKLEPEPARPRVLLTEVGVGYRLVAES